MPIFFFLHSQKLPPPPGWVMSTYTTSQHPIPSHSCNPPANIATDHFRPFSHAHSTPSTRHLHSIARGLPPSSLRCAELGPPLFTRCAGFAPASFLASSRGAWLPSLLQISRPPIPSTRLSRPPTLSLTNFFSAGLGPSSTYLRGARPSSTLFAWGSAPVQPCLCRDRLLSTWLRGVWLLSSFACAELGLSMRGVQLLQPRGADLNLFSNTSNQSSPLTYSFFSPPTLPLAL
jgi:hypothetical protein